MSKYNFNPTPEQLADPKFWASDEVPTGAQWFHPKSGEYAAHFTKIENATCLTFNRFGNFWYHDPIASYPDKKSIKRPEDTIKKTELSKYPNLKLLVDVASALFIGSFIVGSGLGLGFGLIMWAF